MKLKLMTAATLIATMIAGQAAQAAMVSVDYSGTVVHEGDKPVFATGSVARIVFSYDDAAPVTNSASGADFFADRTVAATLYINGQQVPFEAAFASVTNLHYDNFQFSSYASPDFTASVYFGDSDGTTLMPGSLPTAAQLAAFSEATLSVYTGEGFDTFALTPTAAAAVVPEPATWAMMLLGFGMIGGASRYRRRTATIA